MNLGGGSDGFVTKFNLDGTDIIYSTYLGGSGYDSGWGIAIDANGQALLTGTTTSTDFPLLNPMQAVSGGSNDVFITRLSADGGALIYSTYLGGSAIDWAYAIVHDTAGNAYIAGSTSSTNFPVMNPFQATLSGSADGFVSKLTPTGNSLVYSTYLGGGDFEELQGMSINNLGQVYVAGTTNSPDFPVLNPIQPALAGNVDVFITQFSSNGASLEYSSYLGGSGEDRAGEVAVAQTGDIYLAGYTDSANFPIVNPWQATPGGVYDFFVTHLTANGTAFGYSTYLGGIGSEFYADIALDDGELFLVGNSLSEDYPVLNAIQPTLAGNNDIVITGLVNDGSALIFSTYYGGADGENGAAIALDEAGNVYVAGDTHSADFPTTPGAWQRAYAGLGDGFLLKLLSGGTAVGYSTYHGAYPGPTDVTLTDVGGTPVTSWWPFAFIGGLFLLVRGLYGWFAQKR